MADKIYVGTEKFAVKDIFDSKHKGAAVKAMLKAAEKAVKGSAKLTGDAPKGDDAKGYVIDGSLVSLGPDKKGKKLEAEVKLVVSAWPGKNMLAFPSGTAAFEIDGPDAITASDVEDIAAAATEFAMKTAIDYIVKQG